MSSQIPTPTPTLTRHRTFAITLLAVVAVIAGLLAVWDTLRYLGLSPYNIGAFSFFGNINWLGALFSGIVAVIWFSVASQLWNLNPQGWLFVVVIAVFNLILLGLAWLGQSSWEAVAPGIIISGLALILGLLPSTKAAFGIPAK
jgi:hypothetical protein